MKRIHVQVAQATLLIMSMLVGPGCDDGPSDDSARLTGDANDTMGDQPRVAALASVISESVCAGSPDVLSLCDWASIHDLVAVAEVVQSAPLDVPVADATTGGLLSDGKCNGTNEPALRLNVKIQRVLGGRATKFKADSTVALVVGSQAISNWIPSLVRNASGAAEWQRAGKPISITESPYLAGTTIVFAALSLPGESDELSLVPEAPGTVDSSGRVLFGDFESCHYLRPSSLQDRSLSLDGFADLLASCGSRTAAADETYQTLSQIVAQSPAYSRAAVCIPHVDDDSTTGCQTDLECPALHTCRNGTCVAM